MASRTRPRGRGQSGAGATSGASSWTKSNRRTANVKWRPVKALVKTKREPGLWLQDVPEPKPGPGEVLLRVLRTGICGTDLHIDAWNAWAQHTIKPPLVVGPELPVEVVDLLEQPASG